MIDRKLAAILSDFFLDGAKAFFAATFVTPSLTGISSISDIILVLTKGLANVMFFLLISWQMARLAERR